MIKKEHIIPLIAICGTLLISCFILSNAKLNVSNSEFEHSISVEGQWEVHVTPDTVILTMNIEWRAASTKEAQKDVNEKSKSVMNLLSNYKIKESDIKTVSSSTYEDFDWTNNGRVSMWFVAHQTLQVKIKDANIENNWVAEKIISEISDIEWVLLNNVSYDIYDKSEYYSQARELAIQKAHQKAEDLAKYAWVNLWKAISISEWWSNDYALTATRNVKYATNWAFVEEDAIEDEWSSLALWEMNIQLNVSVLYEIK